MNRGCIVTGEMECDGCHRIMGHMERYLLIDEQDRKLRFCVDCCLSKGYAVYMNEKGEDVLTFFPHTLEQESSEQQVEESSEDS